MNKFKAIYYNPHAQQTQELYLFAIDEEDAIDIFYQYLKNTFGWGKNMTDENGKAYFINGDDCYVESYDDELFFQTREELLNKFK